MILKNIYKILVLFMLAFVAYIQHNAQEAVGGGFQAGFIAACTLILYLMAYDKSIPLWCLQKIAALGALIYFVVGACGIKEHSFLLDLKVFKLYNLQAYAGPKLAITLIELGVALTVFSSITIIYIALREHEK
jgi:multicomponent Na+:H+ antiporter subunit B